MTAAPNSNTDSAPARGAGGNVTPGPGATFAAGMQPALQGRWRLSDDGTSFKFNLSDGKSYDVTVDGDTLTITGFDLPLTFDREY